MDPIQKARHLKEIETVMYQKGQKELKPSDEYIAKGRRLGQNVFLKLQKESKRFSIARAHFAGSIGKKTNVIPAPDLDLVCVVNKCVPPFNEVLDDFLEILHRNWRELEIKQRSIERKTNFSIQFEFQCGIEVDLLPAANLTHEQVHRLIAENPRDYYKYSSSLVQRKLEFMTSHQSSFVHIVIRLAKFWFKSLDFGGSFIRGGSTIMELIGVAAAEKEEANNSPVLSAFTQVIEMIINLKSLKLAFKEVRFGRWKRVPEYQIHSRALLPNVIGTEEILKRIAFIIEPANPFNDLLGNNRAKVQDKLIEFAKVTRDRIYRLVNGDYCIVDSATKVVNQLFKPQPQLPIISRQDSEDSCSIL